nr:O-antigen ligase family protein [Pedobacter sp. ASV2]
MKKGELSAAYLSKKKDEKASTKYDLIVIGFFVCYLVIDFLPSFGRIDYIKPQYLYLTILNIAISIYLYFNPSLYSKTIFEPFKGSYVFKLYVIFIFLCGLSILSARNLSLSIVAMAQIMVIFGMLINLVILFYNRLYLIYKVIFIVGVSVCLQALHSLYGFYNLLKSDTFANAFDSTYLKGNGGNINIFSMSILIKVPIIMTGIIHFSGWKKWLLSVALLLATTIIFLINARASLLALFIIVVIFIAYNLKINSFKKNIAIKLLYIILPLIFSLMVANITFKKAQDNGRFSSTLNRLGQINNSDGSINTRLLLWKNAIKFAKNHPVLGIGLDNWKVESIPYEAINENALSLHTHNDFLQCFAETGLLNGFVYLALFALIFILNLRRILKAQNPQAKVIALLSLLMLIVLATDSSFNFPFYIPTMQLQFCLLMVLTIGNIDLKTVTYKTAGKQIKLLPIFLILVCSIPLYITYQSDQTSKLEYQFMADDNLVKAKQNTNLTGDEAASQKPLYPNVLNSSVPFYECIGLYYLREKKFNKATKYFDMAYKINPYLGNIYFYKCIAAINQNNIDSAYFYSKLSIYTRPNNSRNYKFAVELATLKKDSLEILKLYKTVNSVVKKPSDWQNTVIALNTLNYSGLSYLIGKGKKDFPNDTSVINLSNKIIATKYVTEGQKLLATKKNDEALKIFNIGLKQFPDNAAILQNIAFYYYNIGKSKEAIPYFIKACNTNQLTGGQTEYYLGVSYFKLNDKVNGCKYLKLAQEKKFDDPLALLSKCN